MPVAESASYSPGASLRLSPLQGLPFPVSPVSFFGLLLFSWDISSAGFLRKDAVLGPGVDFWVGSHCQQFEAFISLPPCFPCRCRNQRHPDFCSCVFAAIFLHGSL